MNHDIMLCVLRYKPLPVGTGPLSFREKRIIAITNRSVRAPMQTCLEREATVLTFRQQQRKYVLTLMTMCMLLHMTVNVCVLCRNFMVICYLAFNPSSLFLYDSVSVSWESTPLILITQQAVTTRR